MTVELEIIQSLSRKKDVTKTVATPTIDVTHPKDRAQKQQPVFLLPKKERPRSPRRYRYSDFATLYAAGQPLAHDIGVGTHHYIEYDNRPSRPPSRHMYATLGTSHFIYIRVTDRRWTQNHDAKYSVLGARPSLKNARIHSR